MSHPQTPAPQPGPVPPILAGLISTDKPAREQAARRLLQLDDSAIYALADAMNDSDPATAKAAKAGLERLVHHLLTPPPGKSKPDRAVQTRVADTLGRIAEGARPRPVRSHAVSLLGYAGTKRQDKTLERLERDPQIGEDARMARTRIKSAGY